MTAKNRKRAKLGFTLSEVLLAVAILVILLGLVSIPLLRHQRNLRQTELDSKAETIYMAAQNRLSQLQASGRETDYGKDRATPLNNIPWDAEQNKYQNGTLYYVTSATKLDDASAASSILPQEQLERELWDQNWVIEYDPASGSVYAVFYSEQAIQYTFDGFNALRSRSNRLQAGATVGYYGGESVQAEDTGKLMPQMEIINKEQLLLRITCDTPRDPLHFYVTITDSQGHSTGRMELTGSEVNVSYRTYTATMVLDDLNTGKRFSQQRRFRNLTPGSDLTLKVEVESDSKLVDSVTSRLSTNSLFAELRDGGATAVITYARHLQNLSTTSGLPATITRALQEQDIQFVNTNQDDGWDSLYPGRKFEPIQNSSLTYYESTVTVGAQSYHPVIYGLPVSTSGNGGLFESFGGTLRHIRLCGAEIAAGGNAGGLVGTISGSTTIEGCQVYLSPTRDKLAAKTEQDIWISGSQVGGLVGESRYPLTISDSFASTVLEGTRCAGGLVGNSRGSISVTRSYADSYLYSNIAAGGLIGGCLGTTNITLWDCYSAGFLEAPTTAGLVCGEIAGGDTLDTCYTVSARLNPNDRLTYSTGKPAISGDSVRPTVARTYYMAHGLWDIAETSYADYELWSGRNRADAVKNYLDDAFSADTGGSNTVAYNLMEGMGLGAYSYPRLRSLSHYGDWQAEFESGALAYYEEYADGTYGFHGANRSTLRSSGTVVGDGYGMVFHTLPDSDLTVRYTLNGVETTMTLYRSMAVSMGNGYYLLPLPRSLVNTTEVTAGFYHKVQVDDTTYYFNPHFTTRVAEGTTLPDAPSEVGIRTARQLYNLSLYYDEYRTVLPRDAVFQQERSIDYSSYHWAGYGLEGRTVTTQYPIGASEAAPFTHVYDGGGYPIAAVALQSVENGDYAGLFGLNRGTLRNLILTTGEKELSVSLANVATLRTAYLGAIAGRNDGVIYNCAAAGYSITSNAYQGSTLYLGGFTGYNSGTIRSGSVSCPSITANSNYARLYTGGFSGGNSSLIQQSYAMADIEVLQLRGGGAVLGGFTAENTGSVRNSYSATSMASPGADTYGFAPATGSISSCYYLSGGTYRFVGQVHLYDYADTSGARAVNESALKALSLSGFGPVRAGNTYLHSNTQNSTGAAYPYPGSITGAGGSRLHYGDWVTPADLGTLGMVYWEHEEGGSNPGYHFSYIGFENGLRKNGSSLCTAHDDGGKITAYGYGYYWLKGEPEPELEVKDTTKSEGRHAEAAEELARQMPQFDFVTFQTSDTGLRLTSGTTGNGSWTLTQGNIWYTYAVSPFFADSYAVVAVGTGTSSGGTIGTEPGTEALPYQVRSVEQLQYINWSYINGRGSSTEDVTGSGNMYKYYPYLQYSTMSSGQTKASAVAGQNRYGTRPIRSWVQTHDLNGNSLVNKADAKLNYSFHPIAGAVYDCPAGDENKYNLTLYNWFGSRYDGQNYYIKNINIDSYCYNVGIFGTTAGAEIKNIVLYSDNGAVIQRNTDPTPQYGTRTVRQYVTSYALGGLVGIAYDYQENLGNGSITNCAIAGYTVADNSRNQQKVGEAVIGGLVGVSNVNLNKCSAVVDLQINCTHRYDDGDDNPDNDIMNSAAWGNYIRAGGLTGSVRYSVTDCYTGGKISVGALTLKERVSYDDNSKFLANDAVEKFAPQSPSTFVYLGGVGGSGFASIFSNFSSLKDGNPQFYNCYTYMEFPAMTGTITSISLIGSLADRAGADGGAKLYINNCYYLQSSAAIDFTNLSKNYYNDYTKASLATLLATREEQQKMLTGNLSYITKYAMNTGSNEYFINGLTGLTYEQMSRLTGAVITTQNVSPANMKTYDSFTEALGSSFHWVTTTENGAEVHGKYSFPGSNATLLGQNYPFPTVLVQNTSFGQAHLHYGQWPAAGLYWSRGLLTLDMITDYDRESNQSAATLELRFTGSAQATDIPQLTYSKDGIVQATIEPKGKGQYTVRIVGLTTGSTEILATLGDYKARLAVDVTAKLEVQVDQPTVEQYVGESTTLTLSARDGLGNVLSGVTWDVVSETNRVVSLTAVNKNQQFTVTGKGEGEETLLVTVKYALGIREFTSTLRLTATTHMQGVMGIANTADTEAPLYRQEVLKRDLSGWEDPTTELHELYRETPIYDGSTLYLYSRGDAADFQNFTLQDVALTDADGNVHNPLSEAEEDYRLTIGDVVSSGQDGDFRYRPMTLRGRQQGQVTLTITLLDQRTNHLYTLSVPYTLTEQDTQVTAHFVAGRLKWEKTVAFGSAASTNLPTAEELSASALEIAGWTPDVEQPLYGDMTFEAVYKEEGTEETGTTDEPNDPADLPHPVPAEPSVPNDSESEEKKEEEEATPPSNNLS